MYLTYRMEERRAIFEHFVTNRRDDLKAEKKAKLKDAKKAFSALLREQFTRQLSDGAWDAKTSLSVFLTTLEDALNDAEGYKSIQENAMAYLPTSVQEKLYEALVTEFKEQAEKINAEESELLTHLHQQLTTGDAAASLRDAGWESEQLQQIVTAFYSSKASKALLSKDQQRKVYRRAQEALAPKSDSKYGGGGGYCSSRDAQDERPSRYASQSAAPSRGEEQLKSSHDSRPQFRSSHDVRPRSRSRGRSREKDASRRAFDHHRHHENSRSRGDHRSSTRRSPSSSPSSSRSRSHSRRRRASSPRRHHHHRRRSSSSSASSSRSRSTRR